ncbi:inositol phospholipid biosynthesis protein scs3 [Moniliophthora roreri MCA 2997]|uniref:Inositol phospholipid biosynthesis protein scs3 n=1 Tax=Moniliophthora roreri (strain MCA 2997) TaxID=1381753 RepID=V2XV20_MONRO|nr:inositol phospholipid biosynthesis protein scs3 [Moniliophthora roreri MCA 2997]
MLDTRTIAFAAVTAVITFGTAYSVVYGTYLDTSNPLLSHLPHPLSQTQYWARKSNILNVYFIKKAWGWTSAAFLLLWVTSPKATRSSSRILQWLMVTACWLTFTAWFFGPALIGRINLASGGECLVVIPPGDSISVPVEYCFTRSTVTPSSHPHIFSNSPVVPPEWSGVPRLQKGHDVSGHIFLLTMSILFLADQLRASLRCGRWSLAHKITVAVNLTLIGLWLFASYTTSVYFHSPFEKFTGYVLGLASFAVTQLSFFAVKKQHSS